MRLREAFAGCYVPPDGQDRFYLLTKSFGVNLAVRAAFLFTGAASGGLDPARAVFAGIWYQAQDAVFTLYGRTFMNVVSRAEGFVRVGGRDVGGLVFVYIQLCAFEFLNRLVLGPVGETPSAASWPGAALIFVNTFQGMVSGGPVVPALSRLRATGVIGEKASRHLYQATGLTLHFGLLASLGYQRAYATLTGAVLVLSWGAFLWAAPTRRAPQAR